MIFFLKYYGEQKLFELLGTDKWQLDHNPTLAKQGGRANDMNHARDCDLSCPIIKQ